MIRIYHRLKTISKFQIIVLLLMAAVIVLLTKRFSYYETWKQFTVILPDNFSAGHSQNAWVEQQLGYGAIVKNENGKTIATLTDLKSIAINDHRYLMVTYNGLVSISKLTGKTSFQNQPLMLNSTLSLLTDYVQITGRVVAIDKDTVQKSSMVRILARHINAQLWERDQISIGDTITSLSGDTLVKVVGISYDDPASDFSFMFDRRRLDNFFGSTYHHEMTDIILELEIAATESNGVWYLMQRYPLRTNERLALQFPHITLNNLIIQSVDDEIAN
jgi:hypothetical protein